LFACLIFLTFFPGINSQFYNTGQAPASIKWLQINTTDFQIIFPENFITEANRVAGIMDYVYSEIADDYDLKPKKISILLYNESVLSNGYVAWAPKRSEWTTLPPRESYSQDWLEQLALHETRHVVQINNLNRGITKVLSYAFGEAAIAAVAAFLPYWFLEGDAVYSETFYSNSGRGRLADFSKEIRAIELDRSKRFTYDQSYLGSYRDAVPNYYQYGYHMVSYANSRYGRDIWPHVVKHTGKYPVLVAPFYFGLRSQGAASKNKLYHDTFDSLKIFWSNNLKVSEPDITNYKSIPKHRDYTDYIYVQQHGEKVFAVRSGIDDITRFVILSDSTEEIMHTPGIYYRTRISVTNNYLAWEEIYPDLRWEKRNYSVVKVLEVETGKIKKLQSKTRWFSPQFFRDSDTLMYVSVNPDNHFSIVIWNISEDKIIRTIPIPGISNLFSPVWIDNDELAFISLNHTGKSIIVYDINTNKSSVLYHAGQKNIENLSAGIETLFFSLDDGTSKNIYCVDIKNSCLVQLTHSRYGADYPSYDNDKKLLWYSDYTIHGYKPAFIELEDMKKDGTPFITDAGYPWIGETDTTYKQPLYHYPTPSAYTSKPYNKLSHSLNIHSWAPFYIDQDDLLNFTPSIYPGITIFSQNKLSTVTAQLNYYYTKKSHYFKSVLTIQALYPEIELQSIFSNNPAIINKPADFELPHNLQNNWQALVNIRLPLNFTTNKFNRYLIPRITFWYNNRYYYTGSSGLIQGIIQLEPGISFGNLLKRSFRDIEPRFGQVMMGRISFLQLGDSLYSSPNFTCNLIQYLPGLFKHHNFRIDILYKGQEKNTLTINSPGSLPRGIEKDFLRILRGSAEYTFPLIYPDLSIGPAAYIKRIHTTLYYDIARIKYYNPDERPSVIRDEYFSSFGFILFAEIHFLRFFIPLKPGIRFSYLPGQKNFDLGLDVFIDLNL